MAVTPVRIALAGSVRVQKPTSTPGTSVMAFNGPGWPAKGKPRSRARGLGMGRVLSESGLCSLGSTGRADQAILCPFAQINPFAPRFPRLLFAYNDAAAP